MDWFRWGREDAFHQFEQLVHADAIAGTGEDDGHEMAVTQAVFERVADLRGGQRGFACIQVVLHDLVVDLDHLVDDVLVGFTRRGKIRVARGLEERIAHGASLRGGKIQRQAFMAEFHAQLVDQQGKVDAFDVDAIDDDDACDAAFLRMGHHRSRAMFDAVGGIDHDRDGIGGGKRGQGGSAEIGIAGRVEQMDAIAVALDGRDGRVDRMTSRLFHGIGIGNGTATFDAAHAGQRAAGVEHGFEQGGLAGSGVAGKG